MGSCATRPATLGKIGSDSSRTPDLCNSSITCWNATDPLIATNRESCGDPRKVSNLFSVQHGSQQAQYQHIEEFKPDLFANHTSWKRLSCILDQENRHCPEQPY